jgi:DNA invertase Pin-like site-specific DNA recombinase
MRVAVYARVSTKDKGQDPENQLAQLREFAKAQGWIVVNEYIDHVSGKTSDRAQFKRLFADASRRLFDLVLFWFLDRFSREGALDTLKHLERLAQYGVGYRSYTEQYLDSCGIFKDAVLSIIATVARQERIRLSDRTKPTALRPAWHGHVAKAASAAGRGWCWTATKCSLSTSRGSPSRKSPTSSAVHRYP